jgi:hypothetical protein
MPSRTQRRSSENGNSGNRVADYFADFVEVARLYGDNAALLVADRESAPLVEHHRDTGILQIARLGEMISAAYAEATPEQRAQVDMIMDLAAANETVAGARAQIGSRGPRAFGSFGTIFELLKKIIPIIIKFLPGIGQVLGPIIQVILDIIDENKGEQARMVSKSAVDSMHDAQIKYLEVQYHLKRLENLDQQAREKDDNGDQ